MNTAASPPSVEMANASSAAPSPLPTHPVSKQTPDPESCKTLDSYSKSPFWACKDPVTITVKELVHVVPIKEFLPGCTVTCGLSNKNRRTLEDKKILLDRVSLVARPGELLAIVGPSGGGKTTLLNVLAARVPKWRLPHGHVKFNGREETRGSVKATINYVMAHDKMLPYLTVFETLAAAADLKLSHLSKVERRERVESIIRDMCLEKARDTLIGGDWRKGISTGELKRVSIGIELLDEPSVLILDEPTSGLDTNLSLRIMTLLQREARKGRTIITTVHQPSSQIFELFDRFLLISHGQIVYHGRTSEVLPYFAKLGYVPQKNWNPSDYLLDLISDRPNRASELAELGQGDGSLVGDATNATDFSAGMDPCPYLSEEERYALIENWTAGPQQQEILQEIELVESSLTSRPLKGQAVDNEPGQAAGPQPTTPTTTMKTAPEKRSFGRWCNEVVILWKRSTRNSLRNPMTAIVAVLIQLMQGLILGGIFFNSTAVSAGPKPTPMFTEETWRNRWFNAYHFGVDGEGNRPFVTMFEHGVDGAGSYVLFDSQSEEGAWQDPVRFMLDEAVSCIHEHFVVGLDGTYPPLPVLDDPPSTSWDEWSYQRIYSNLMAAYQFVDFGYMRGKLDLSFVNECAEQYPGGDAVMFYMCMLQEGGETLNPLVTCAGLPPLPGFGRLLGQEGIDVALESNATAQAALKFNRTEVDGYGPQGVQSRQRRQRRAEMDQGERRGGRVSPSRVLKAVYESAALVPKNARKSQKNSAKNSAGPVDVEEDGAAARRRLITITGSYGMERQLASILGDDLMQLVYASEEWLTRATTCSDPFCGSLLSVTDFVAEWTTTTVNTVAGVLNFSGCLFFVAAIIGFASYDSLLSFPQERALFNRETANGLYGTSSYYVAKNLSDVPFQVLPTILMATVFYLLVGFDLTAQQYFTFFGICLLTIFCAYGFAYMVSAASPRMEIAMLVAPFTLVIWLVLAGFFLRDGDIPGWIDWFKYFSFYRWSFFSMVSNQFPAGGYFGTLPNEVTLALCGITTTNLAVTTGVMLGLGAVYRILGYVFLATTNRRVGLEA